MKIIILYQKIITYFSDTNVPFWKDLLWSSILIPISGFMFYGAWSWLNNHRPLKSLFKDYIDSNFPILIFTAQLSQGIGKEKVRDPRYIQEYPKPTPRNKNQIESIENLNIDPVWSEGDGLCISELFNLLGSANIKKEVRIANTINDWGSHSSPIITVGFNVKTTDLEKLCTQIDYTLKSTLSINSSIITNLSIKGFDHYLHDQNSDAGIIQKTYLKETGAPVMILAGIGTTGTSIAGYVLKQKAADIGRLYGNNSFCLLFKTNMSGVKSYEIKGIFPKPRYLNLLLHPITYIRWFRKDWFPK